MEKEDYSPENQYYNVLLPYQNSLSNQAVYTATLTQGIVNVPKNYNLAMDRFNIPMTSVPLFFFQPNTYYVELSYNGVDSGAFPVIFINSDEIPEPTPPVNPSRYHYAIYSYSQFLLMVNQAIHTALAHLGTLVTLPANATSDYYSPYFSYNPTLNTIQLTVSGIQTSPSALPAPYDNTPPNPYTAPFPNPIFLYMNINMFHFFEGIPYKLVSNAPPAFPYRNVTFELTSQGMSQVPYSFTVGINTYTGFNNVYTSEYGSTTLIAWNIAKGFVITSNKMPINFEYLPNLTNNSQLNGTRVIANFDFIYTPNQTKPLFAQYILQSPYKEINLMGSSPLSQVDISMFWYDYENNFYPIYLYYGEALSLRMVFLKKSKIPELLKNFLSRLK
jgi:hypothetical protein